MAAYLWNQMEDIAPVQTTFSVNLHQGGNKMTSSFAFQMMDASLSPLNCIFPWVQ